MTAAGLVRAGGLYGIQVKHRRRVIAGFYLASHFFVFS
jgi:hypothetical protein